MRSLATLSLLLSLCACEDAARAACEPKDETYRVAVTLSLPEPAKTSGEVPVEEGRVLATVTESNSVIACENGVATDVTPGRALLSNVPVYVDAAGFTLRVASTFYPELSASPLSLLLLFDENANGQCDDGEPSASAPLERSAQSKLALALASAPCPRLQ